MLKRMYLLAFIGRIPTSMSSSGRRSKAVSDPRRGQRSGGFPPTIHPLSLAVGPLDAVRGRRVPVAHAPCFLSLMRLCAHVFLLYSTLPLSFVRRTRRAFICGSLTLTSTCF